MSKITLPSIGNTYSIVPAIDARLQQVEDALNNDVLWRTYVDGEPNEMNTTLDMGSNQIINVTDGVNANDAVNVGQVQSLVAEAIVDLTPGLGNVVGPASAVDGNLVVYDGATGKLIKDGGDTLSIPLVSSTFAALASISPTLNKLVTTLGHTNVGYGSALYVTKSGSVTNDGGTKINSAVGGLYFEMENPYELTPYNFGATGASAAVDNAAIVTAIAAIKNNNRGTLIIPATIHKDAVVPALGLTTSQAIVVIDLRIDRNNTPVAFGVEEHYIEGKSAGDLYTSEFRVSGKQNPSFSLYPKSDGTASGFTYANNLTTLVSLDNTGLANVKYSSDPYFHGRKGDWCFGHYASGTFSYSLYAGVDNNNKTRLDLTPGQLALSNINITSISNTTPIVITTTTPHGALGATVPVSLSGTGVSSLNGTNWVAQVSGASTLTLLNSIASGTGGASGVVSLQINSQRATLNVPAIQGGSESIVGEGKVIAAGTSGIFVSEAPLGTAPLNVTSQSVDANLTAHPYVVSTTGTQQNNGLSGSGNTKIVVGTTTLVAGTVTVTLTGNAIFNSASSYRCVTGNTANANAVKVVQTSGSSLTFTGTGTDTINFICIGY